MLVFDGLVGNHEIEENNDRSCGSGKSLNFMSQWKRDLHDLKEELKKRRQELS